MRKCPVCGRDTKFEICAECYIERKEIVSFHPYVEIRHCPKCGRFFDEKWKDIEEISAIYSSSIKQIYHDPLYEIESVEIIQTGMNNAILKINGKILGETVTKEIPFEIRRRNEVCERCSRFYGGYFESIIQIRADGRNIESYELERAKKIVNEEVSREKDNPTAFVSKIEKRKEGIDFYIGDRNLAKKISRKIAEELGGTIKESKKISGRKDGRDIYRTTYSIRFKAYREGDVVKDDDRILVVTNPAKDKAIDSRGRTHRLRNPVVIKRREDVEWSVVVNADEDVVEVLRPYDQAIVQARNPSNLRIGEKVMYIEDGREIHVFPSLEE
jgi:nonsense-mediated mRNA decay protein 3